jgi:hypothetical protein
MATSNVSRRARVKTTTDDQAFEAFKTKILVRSQEVSAHLCLDNIDLVLRLSPAQLTHLNRKGHLEDVWSCTVYPMPKPAWDASAEAVRAAVARQKELVLQLLVHMGLRRDRY